MDSIASGCGITVSPSRSLFLIPEFRCGMWWKDRSDRRVAIYRVARIPGPRLRPRSEVQLAVRGSLCFQLPFVTARSGEEFSRAGIKTGWICMLQAPTGGRIEFEFVEEFSFLCTSTCVDYVEMKISADLRSTGFRL